MKRSDIFLLLAGVLTVMAAGCVNIHPEPPKSAIGTLPKEHYAPIERYRLELAVGGNRQMVAGRPGRLTFILTNTDTETLRLPEWYSYESDNVLVFCQPWLPGTNVPDEDNWTPLTFDLNKPPVRYPLELFPGNRVTVTKQLDFIRNLVVSPGAERRYFVKGVLNLKSVQVSSPVAAIAVLPANETVK